MSHTAFKADLIVHEYNLPALRFLACCNKSGLSLLRSEFLALERSVPKDRMGRFNFYHLAELVEAVSAAKHQTTTAPDAISTLRSTASKS